MSSDSYQAQFCVAPDGKLSLLLTSARSPSDSAQVIYKVSADCLGVTSTAKAIRRCADVVGSGDEEKTLSLEEKLRRERLRQLTTGINEFSVARGGSILFSQHGDLFRQFVHPIEKECEKEELLLRSADFPGCIVNVPQSVPSGAGEGLSSASDVGQHPILNVKPSPDGKWVAFVHNSALFMMPLAPERQQGQSSSREVYLLSVPQFPSDDKPEYDPYPPKGISYGTADYLSQEEFHRLDGFWWSSDSKKICYQVTDDSHVPRVTLKGDKPKDAQPEGVPVDPRTVLTEPSEETHAYPYAGRPNPLISFRVIDLTRFMAVPATERQREERNFLMSQAHLEAMSLDLGKKDLLVEEMRGDKDGGVDLAVRLEDKKPEGTVGSSTISSRIYVPRIDWDSSSEAVVLTILNRRQNVLDLVRFPLPSSSSSSPSKRRGGGGGDIKGTLLLREIAPSGWLQMPGNASSPYHSLAAASAQDKEYNHFLWSTERSGYRHLVVYKHRKADGGDGDESYYEGVPPNVDTSALLKAGMIRKSKAIVAERERVPGACGPVEEGAPTVTHYEPFTLVLPSAGASSSPSSSSGGAGAGAAASSSSASSSSSARFLTGGIAEEVRAVTGGSWTVDQVLGVYTSPATSTSSASSAAEPVSPSSPSAIVFFSGTAQSPLETHLYAAPVYQWSSEQRSENSANKKLSESSPLAVCALGMTTDASSSSFSWWFDNRSGIEAQVARVIVAREVGSYLSYLRYQQYGIVRLTRGPGIHGCKLSSCFNLFSDELNQMYGSGPIPNEGKKSGEAAAPGAAASSSDISSRGAAAASASAVVSGPSLTLHSLDVEALCNALSSSSDSKEHSLVTDNGCYLLPGTPEYAYAGRLLTEEPPIPGASPSSSSSSDATANLLDEAERKNNKALSRQCCDGGASAFLGISASSRASSSSAKTVPSSSSSSSPSYSSFSVPSFAQARLDTGSGRRRDQMNARDRLLTHLLPFEGSGVYASCSSTVSSSSCPVSSFALGQLLLSVKKRESTTTTSIHVVPIIPSSMVIANFLPHPYAPTAAFIAASHSLLSGLLARNADSSSNSILRFIDVTAAENDEAKVKALNEKGKRKDATALAGGDSGDSSPAHAATAAKRSKRNDDSDDDVSFGDKLVGLPGKAWGAITDLFSSSSSSSSSSSASSSSPRCAAAASAAASVPASFWLDSELLALLYPRGLVEKKEPGMANAAFKRKVVERRSAFTPQQVRSDSILPSWDAAGSTIPLPLALRVSPEWDRIKAASSGGMSASLPAMPLRRLLLGDPAFTSISQDEHSLMYGVIYVPTKSSSLLSSAAGSVPDLTSPSVRNAFGSAVFCGSRGSSFAVVGPSPLVLYVYGGPGAQFFSNIGNMLNGRISKAPLVASGCALAMFDGRGSTRRGCAFERPIWLRLGDAETADQISVLQQLVLAGVADPQRIAVTGWSYGGYETLQLLASPVAGSSFCGGVSGAPVTCWRCYDTAYTERFMLQPSENRYGYSCTSFLLDPTKVNGLLQARNLTVLHGTLDENVHPNNSRLLDEVLTTMGPVGAAGIPNKVYKHDPTRREVIFIPGERHAVRGEMKKWVGNEIPARLLKYLGCQ
jgi:Prolyl oligopeptidase family/Dipeptidyl peptidase IV (DPP IV) N-terminal region